VQEKGRCYCSGLSGRGHGIAPCQPCSADFTRRVSVSAARASAQPPMTPSTAACL